MADIDIPALVERPTGASIIEKWRHDTEQYRKDAKVRFGRALVLGFVEPTLEDYIDKALSSLSAQLARQQAVVEAAATVCGYVENQACWDKWPVSFWYYDLKKALDAASTKEQGT